MTSSPSSRKEKEENPKETIRPFEWLTSPLSLSPFLDDLFVANNNSKILLQKQQRRPRRALHVGCGSSTVSEFLIKEYNFDLVVDLDKDFETIEKMKLRWQQKQKSQLPDQEEQQKSLLEFCICDFTIEAIPYPSEYFGFILDKSTLDCTLCSDNATACLLKEIYRCLSVDGIYMVISFHDIDLLRPLLQNMPYTNWNLTCTTMERQVEHLITSDKPKSTTTTTPAHTDCKEDKNKSTTISSSSSKPLNVIIARKMEPKSDDDVVSDEIVLESIIEHVHNVNDTWFQHQQPLLTRQRKEQLKDSFATLGKENEVGNDNKVELCVELKQAYQIMFTDAEREHLTFEHFLEDWNAFLLLKKQKLKSDKNKKMNCHGDGDENDIDNYYISFDIALEFLNEMQ